ncbi:MAG: hypothetical protein FJ303_14345 [Planctomycetes bacterium]|nr:hypothetical protein [Planctomycetota bacterium]
MNAILFAALVISQGVGDLKDRERHPLAPSLPRLTKAESDKIDAVIDRFILADIGKLKGAEAKKALDDFKGLGPEAIFNLIDGLNRAADMESSCPAVIIAKKVGGILTTTGDIELLSFAKENIGAGVTAKRHLNVLKDLQFNILLRKNTVQRQNAAAAAKVSAMSMNELESAISKGRGSQLKSLLTEAEKRLGPKSAELLIMGLANADVEIVKLAKGLLAKNLQRQNVDTLKMMLKHENRDVRIIAINAVGAKKMKLGNELIGLLESGDSEVARAAQRALVQLSGGADYGDDVTRWRDWWAKQR